MAYVAVSGGEEAIAASLELLKNRLSKASGNLEVKTIAAALPELVDQVMSESSLYDPTLAALALKQGGGSVEEAVFLLRAFRSTLERPYTSRTIDTSTMRVSRRISAAFKDIPGGQILGITRDYSHRLLDFSLADNTAPCAGEASDPSRCPELASEQQEKNVEPGLPHEHRPCGTEENRHVAGKEARLSELDGYLHLPKVAAYLQKQGLLVPPPHDDTPPRDLTMEPLSFPAPRSVRLQALTRGMTQAVMALGYAAIRGFGPAHPTVGELRSGYVELFVPYAPDSSESVCIGEILITEVECYNCADDKDKLKLSSGYGAVFGRNENKAIAMAVLDYELDCAGPYPAQDEEFVLTHGDSLEMNGFISHLKLPHYVTFQSKLDSVRKTRAERDE